MSAGFNPVTPNTSKQIIYKSMVTIPKHDVIQHLFLFFLCCFTSNTIRTFFPLRSSAFDVRSGAGTSLPVVAGVALLGEAGPDRSLPISPHSNTQTVNTHALISGNRPPLFVRRQVPTCKIDPIWGRSLYAAAAALLTPRRASYALEKHHRPGSGGGVFRLAMASPGQRLILLGFIQVKDAVSYRRTEVVW